MKRKTKGETPFFLIIILPIVLLTIAFLGFSFVLAARLETAYGIQLRTMPLVVRKLTLDVIFITVMVLALTGVFLSTWLYRGVTKPLRKLSDATHKIRDGELDFSIEEEGPEEVRELCRDLEEMRVRLKEASEIQVEFDRESKELISNISHDLRTPIAAIKGYVEGIMDGVADTPEKMDHYVRTIYNKSNEMERLINELTFYSKIDTNRMPYAFAKVNVDRFFDDAAEDMSLELDGQGVSFFYKNTVPTDAEVIADVEQIRRVINNIISNSLKYMDKPEKKMSMLVSESGDFIDVAIKDNGIGIPRKDLANVFNRFYRVDASRQSGQGGSGIGLSIVKKIIEDHGGRVWVTSTEGEETTMHFELRKYIEPFAEEQEKALPEKAEAKKERKKTGKA